MSTKTTFKRIALVAVAALGLGVLSVAPSNAATSSVTLTAVAGTASVTNSTTGLANADSTTAALVTVSSFMSAASTDSVSVIVYEKSRPAGAKANGAVFGFYDTQTTNSLKPNNSVVTDSFTVGNSTGFVETAVAAGYTSHRFWVQVETQTAGILKGTYVYTVAVQAYSSGAIVAGGLTTTDVSIVASNATAIGTTVAPALTTAILNAGTGSAATTDDAVTAVATAATTVHGTVRVKLYNSSSAQIADDSVTATVTGAGVISFDGTNYGKSITYSATGGSAAISIRADGTAGTGTIAISTTGATFSKTVSFFAKSPKTITAAVNNPVLKIGANASAVVATAVDANGNAWTGSLYIVASAAADALIGGSATAPVGCTYSSALAVHVCPITTLTTGTASFKVVDQTLDTDATYAAADSAATSAAVSVTVSNAPAATVKLAFDKASYAPFEKAIITVTVLDAAGKTLQGAAYTNLFATGGITATQAFGSSSDTLTAVALTTSSDSSATAPRTAGAYTYTVYMPAQGTVTISATGGTSLAAAGRVAVSASADIVNSSVDAATDAANEATDAANAATDAALAAADAADAATAAAQDASDAVAALSASVSKLISSLRAQITSLTNLVIKIQKKVKA